MPSCDDLAFEAALVLLGGLVGIVGGVAASVGARAPLGALEREADLAIVDIDAEDLDFDFVADLDDVGRVLDLVIGEFADVQQAFEAGFEFDEDAEVGDLGDFALDDHAGLVVGGDGMEPGVFGHLLEAEGDAVLFLIDREDDALDFVALLEQFARVSDLLGPGEIADVQEAVDAFFDFDESAVVGEVADLAGDDSAGGILLGEQGPGVGFGLLHAEADFLLGLVDVEDDHFDLLADADHFARVVDAFGPAHFGDVDEAFDAFFELHERTIGHDVRDGALDAGADGVLLFSVLPRRSLFLLQTMSDLLFFLIDVEDDHFDFLIELDHVAGVVDAAPGHIGDVEEAIDAAEVDERAEVGDVLDGALAGLADGDFAEEFLLGFAALFFEELAAGDDDVAAFEIDLEDFGIDGAADVFADVGGATDVDLGGGEEDGDADIDEEAALDLAGDLAGDGVAFFFGLDDFVPTGDAVGLAFGDDDEAVVGFDLFEEDGDFIADFDILHFLGIPFAGEGEDAFGLEADFDDDIIAVDVDDFAFEDGAVGEGGAGGVEEGADGGGVVLILKFEFDGVLGAGFIHSEVAKEGNVNHVRNRPFFCALIFSAGLGTSEADRWARVKRMASVAGGESLTVSLSVTYSGRGNCIIG